MHLLFAHVYAAGGANYSGDLIQSRDFLCKAKEVMEQIEEDIENPPSEEEIVRREKETKDKNEVFREKLGNKIESGEAETSDILTMNILKEKDARGTGAAVSKLRGGLLAYIETLKVGKN